jgi:hypothetical protein
MTTPEVVEQILGKLIGIVGEHKADWEGSLSEDWEKARAAARLLELIIQNGIEEHKARIAIDDKGE